TQSTDVSLTPPEAVVNKETFQYVALWYRAGPFGDHNLIKLAQTPTTDWAARSIDFKYKDWEGVVKFLSHKNLKDFENSSIPLTAEELLFLSYVSRLNNGPSISIENYNRI